MTIDFQALLFDIESAVNQAKVDSVLRLDCEENEALALIHKALKTRKIASLIKLKNLKVDVIFLDPYAQAQIPVCSDHGEVYTAIADHLTEENPTRGEDITIIFSANEGTILALMGALLSTAQASDLFDDDDVFAGFLYNAIDCGVSEVQKMPDVVKEKLLNIAKEMVSYRVKKSQRSAEI